LSIIVVAYSAIGYVTYLVAQRRADKTSEKGSETMAKIGTIEFTYPGTISSPPIPFSVPLYSQLPPSSTFGTGDVVAIGTMDIYSMFVNSGVSWVKVNMRSS
jgi:hypothetical protein